ncbi:MAG: 6-phosphogluconolactonase [Rubrivivax sp.]|nr:MAG: 6-phosphogluconolactonase [Rubrivivax sp.]
MHDAPCQFHEAPNAAALAQALALWVAERLREGLAARGEALLVVSGGSTPVPFFEAMSLAALDWSNVTVTLADERWVPPDHADSNERLVRAHLMRGLAAPLRFVPLKTADQAVAEGLPKVEQALADLHWPADVMVLGMGGDAHTASLFPRAPELSLALQDPGTVRCLAVKAPALPNVPVDRISLSRKALLDTRHLVLHVTGAAKRALLAQAMQAGPVQDMPIRLALQQAGIPCHVFCSN